jgi:hypothetical protein
VTTATASISLGRWTIRIATVACLVLGAASVLRVVGPERLGLGAGDGPVQPIAFDDYALQFYYGQLGARHLEEGGVTYGYDPKFMAGYPKTPVYYPSSKPFEYTLAFFADRDPGSVFNLVVFAMLALGPLLIFGAAVNFGLSPGERLAATALCIAPHLLVPMAGFYGIMEAAGMVPYIFASFLSVYVVSLVERFLARGERRTALALLVAAPLLYRTHLTAVFISAVPIAAIYLKRFREAPWIRHAWLWAVLVVIVTANWSWVQGYFLYNHYSDLSEFYTAEGSTHFVPKGGWLSPLRVYIASPAFMSLIPAIFGAIGLFAWSRARRTTELVVFAPQIAFLFIVSFYGAFLGLNPLAPARITLPLALYLCFPAAHGLALALGLACDRLDRAVPAVPRVVVVTGVVAACVSLVALSALPKTFWRPYTLPRLEQREGFSEHGMALIDWIDRNTDPSGRLLHEETDRDSHQYYGTHMPAWIPYYTDLEMAGSPAPHALLKHNFLRFIAGSFQGEPIRKVPARKLRSYFSLYNVRWVLCWRAGTRMRFDRLPFATLIDSYDKFALYQIEIPPSYFVQGSGKIAVDGSRIRLSELEPSDGVVTIKYHWLESLRTDPPLTIVPVQLLDDPIPYISLVDPPSEVVIYNDFDFGLGDRPG